MRRRKSGEVREEEKCRAAAVVLRPGRHSELAGAAAPVQPGAGSGKLSFPLALGWHRGSVSRARGVARPQRGKGGLSVRWLSWVTEEHPRSGVVLGAGDGAIPGTGRQAAVGS